MLRIFLFLTLLPFSLCVQAQIDPDTVATLRPPAWYLGVGVGTSIDKTTQDESQSASAQLVGGWNVYPWLGVGAGIGIHDAYFRFEQFQFAPLFGQIRVKSPGKFGVLAFLNTGYAFSLRKDERDEFFVQEYDGGWLWHFGGGFRFKVKEADLQLTLNHRSFQSSITSTNIWQGEVTFVSEQQRKFNRIEIMLALEI